MGWIEEMDWLKAAGGGLVGVLGAALGIGIPKGLATAVLGASKAVTGVAGLTDIGIGIGAASQVTKQRDDFYRGALVGVAGWEILTGLTQVAQSVMGPRRIEVSLGRGGGAGTYTVRRERA